MHERVYLLLKGGGFRSFLKYAHAISHVVCVIIRSTHTLTPYTHYMDKKNDGETHLKTIYIYIIYLCTFLSFFFLTGLLYINDELQQKMTPIYWNIRVSFVFIFSLKNKQNGERSILIGGEKLMLISKRNGKKNVHMKKVIRVVRVDTSTGFH